jgi:hypothetical protein
MTAVSPWAYVTYSGPVQLQICRRLGADWRDLAIYLEIKGRRLQSFIPGYESTDIWTFLEQRGRLAELAPALRGIGRIDLAVILERSDPLRDLSPMPRS